MEAKIRYTLLEIVQRVLESMDSDEVNSISATTESMAVANIAKECYYDIVGDIGLTEHHGLFPLVASGDSLLPCKMSLPDAVISLDKLEYNVGTIASPEYSQLIFLPLEDFLNRTNKITGTGTGTQTITINDGQFVFRFHNDRWPTYYTTPDDRTLLFDAFDLSEDSTLSSSRTRCFGLISPTFSLQDTFTPVLDPRQFQLWLQATKAQAFVELKQSENPKAERKERRNWILARRTKDGIDKRPAIQRRQGYGRK